MFDAAKASSADRIVIATASIVGILVLVPVCLLAFGFGIMFFFDWDYNYHRERVDSELAKLGLPNSPAPDSPHARQPDLAIASPDGKWTLVAQWIDVRGYNWGVRNNQTRKVYLQVEKILSEEWFPPHIDVLWSPDGAYVAVNSELGLEVAHRRGDEAVGTDISLGSDEWERKILLNAADQAQFEGWCGGHLKALRWEGPGQLAVECYVDVRMKDNTERAVAAHLVLRFTGESFDVISKAYDFYESLPDDT
jgi:hypothetical protein